MRIENKIKDYLVFSGDSILEALRRINANKARIIFVVEDSGVLIGAVSDGDVRRWITETAELDLNRPIDLVMNRQLVALPITTQPAEITEHFDHKRDMIPLTDAAGRFVAVAKRHAEGLQLGGKLLTEQGPTFIIAEVGNNHNGDLGLAKRLVDLALEAGADCVKFQMRDLTSLYSNEGKTAEGGYDLGSQYTLDLLNRFQLSNDELLEVFDYCCEQDILPLCTPWDLASLRVLEGYEMAGYKLASADLTNHELLEAVAETGKPMICSTGMSTEVDIRDAVALLRRLGAPFALLHCNSTYPTPYKDVNLSYLSRLKQLAGALVGYSGHERGIAIPVAAVAMGAKIIEKHFTVDRGMEGNDHKVSLLPNEFAEMVRQIRAVEESMGQPAERELTQGELINRENLAKSLVITQHLPEGGTIRREMIAIKSPGQGLQPNRIEEIVGKVAQRDFRPGDLFFESDIKQQTVRKSRYRFCRPYGIPVRYHDYRSLTEGLELDFVEFHLSYHDLDVRLPEILPHEPQSIGYAVHSPELFARDHLLDLATSNADYRRNSVEALRRVVDVATELRTYFPKTQKPVLVLNAGGWTQQGSLPVTERADLYERVAESLSEVDLSPVELAIQTMPPFPWHFGGQSYHNLFVDHEEIRAFSDRTGHKICLDVSHSMMACNYFKWGFGEFLDAVLPHTVHLHIVDAKGVDGEGVQIGKGDVDFNLLRTKLNQFAPGVQFIPEVWQGHKNRGEGFWQGLEFLERAGI